MKTKKGKVRKTLKCVNKFSLIFDVTNYLMLENLLSKIEFHKLRNQTIEQKMNFTRKIENKDIAWISFTKLSHA